MLLRKDAPGAGKNSLLLLIFASALVSACWAAQAEKDYFPSFADKHTVGLWLFDETYYPYTTLTDAGRYEYDLRLMKGGKLVPGKYGNCLKMTPGLDYNTSFAAWQGSVGFRKMREMSGKPGSGIFGPTIAPEKLLTALSKKDFTCEFWLLLMSKPTWDVALIDLGDKFEPGFKVTLKGNAEGFVIENAYGGWKAVCPVVLEQIAGRSWHHVAFTYCSQTNKLRYFVDGLPQQNAKVNKVEKTSAPESVHPRSVSSTTYGIFEKENRAARPDYDIRVKNRFNFAIGHDRHGENDFNGNIDELRFSDIIRYTQNFSVPHSFSRNYGPDAPAPAVPNGPPLLFGKNGSPYEPVKLGSRKYVFIDEVIVDRKRNIKFVVNQPTEPRELNELTAWDGSFFERDGKIYTAVSDSYESSRGRVFLLVSEDGVHFEKPNLGVVEYKGSKDNNLIMIWEPSWGEYFKDTNPNVPPEERFKATLWGAQRGIYLYFSPDGIRWRRNETCMLPLVSGGGCATFWDDQQGCYFNYLKRDGSYNTGEFPNAGRSTTMFKTREVNKAWPFNKVTNPYFEGWPFPAVTGEGLTVFDPNIFEPGHGHVFRTRPQKYPWAPDTYVAFLLRNDKADLATSRDGVHWRICSNEGLGYYWKDMISHGMVRKGDKIWQWGGKGNLLRIKTSRLTQRLDGFCSVDAGDKTGTIITRPLIFDGEKLVLNVKTDGYVRVALLSPKGLEMTSLGTPLLDKPKVQTKIFGIAECDPIKTDSVRHVVTWGGSSYIGRFSGQVVRLRFEMQNAKLYAFKFD